MSQGNNHFHERLLSLDKKIDYALSLGDESLILEELEVVLSFLEELTSEERSKEEKEALSEMQESIEQHQLQVQVNSLLSDANEYRRAPSSPSIAQDLIDRLLAFKKLLPEKGLSSLEPLVEAEVKKLQKVTSA